MWLRKIMRETAGTKRRNKHVSNLRRKFACNRKSEPDDHPAAALWAMWQSAPWAAGCGNAVQRHCAETIEKVIEGNVEEVCCEESSIRRIRAWWAAYRQYFQSVLASLEKKYGRVFTKEPTPKEIVRAVVNVHLWIHTWSAFFTGGRADMLIS